MEKKIPWIIGGLLFFLFFPFSTKAVGLSPPQVFLGTVDAGETNLVSMRLQRDIGEVGQINFTVSAGGDQSDNFVGDEAFVMQAAESAYNYSFVFTPESASTGDYTLYVRFYYTVVGDEVDDPEVVGNSVAQGVTGTVTFSMVGSSGGGGGGGGGRQDEDEEEEEEADEEVEEVPVEEEEAEVEEELIEEEEADEEVEEVPVEEEEAEVGEELVDNEEEAVEGVTEEPVEGEPASAELRRGEEDVFDLDGDGEIWANDVEVFFADLIEGNARSDFDLNDVVGLRDLSLLASNWSSDKNFDSGLPPIVVGPPLEENGVFFRFQVAEEDAWRFQAVLSSSETTDDDLVSVYVLVDTGSGGVNAADLKVGYETDKFSFVGSDLVGTIFPIFLPEPVEISPGVIKIMAATPTDFVGTNGLVARLDFAVLAGGESELDFFELAAYENGGKKPEHVSGTDFLGLIEVEEVKFFALPVETKEVVSRGIECLGWFWWFFPSCFNLVPLLLLLALATDLSAILLFYHYRRCYLKKYEQAL